MMNTTLIIIIVIGMLSLATFPEITYRFFLKRYNRLATQKQETEKCKDEEEAATKKGRERTEWELNEKIMTCIKLTVGDTYQCMLTENEKYEVGSRRIWRSTEPFVGSINDSTAIFKALKIGSTYIECSEVLVYYIEVKPKSAWFAEDIYDMICGKTDVSSDRSAEICNCVKTRLGRCLSSIDTELACTDDGEGEKTKAIRILMRIKNVDISRITQGLDERMEMLLQNQSTQIWVHKTGRTSENIIDYAAFLMSGDSEEIIFGLGQNWRLGGSEAELRANSNVFIHSFKKYLKEDELPQISASAINMESQSVTQTSDSVTSNEKSLHVKVADDEQEGKNNVESEDEREQNDPPEDDTETEYELIIDEELLAEERIILEEEY